MTPTRRTKRRTRSKKMWGGFVDGKLHVTAVLKATVITTASTQWFSGIAMRPEQSFKMCGPFSSPGLPPRPSGADKGESDGCYLGHYRWTFIDGC